MLSSHPRAAVTTACLLLTLLTLTEAAAAQSPPSPPPTPPPQTFAIDKLALLALRKSIRPSASLLPSWLSNDPCADAWEGVICSPTGRVTQISILAESGTVDINHSLPAELGNLSDLTNLTLSSLGFSGQIPSELGHLGNLTHLDLHGNRLVGPIPATLGHLSELSELHLNDNSLSGNLKPELFRQFAQTGCRLQTLLLDRNNLTGPVPPELASLTDAGARLDTISLSNNALSGFLPPAIFSTDVRINVANNSLSGPVPADIAWRTDGSDLSGNLFVGSFPTGFPPEAVAGNCFAAEMQRDSRECALAYPSVQCGCRPPQVTGILGLCRCVTPLQLRAEFSANHSEALGGFSLDLQAALDWIASAASVGSRQVALVNFSTTPVPPAVELWLNLLPATGTEIAADQQAAIETALSGRINVYFTSGFWLSKVDFTPDSPMKPETVGPSSSPLIPAPQPGPQPEQAHTPSTSRRSISNAMEIAGTSFAILLVAGLGAGFALCLWRSTCKAERGSTSDSSLKSWTLSELKAATNNFKDTNIVGVGGFGVVYRGNLAGKTAAIKRLKVWSSQGWDEFLKEQITVGGISNRNLVTMRGYCVEAGERLLVYDFMTYGSLEDALFKSVGSRPLSWSQCLNILMGTARAVAHLHSKKIIHRDIKPVNILLDQNFEARVSDFGLSRCTPVASTLHSTRHSSRLKGTMGYMAPEYAHTGHLTEKSDVYSTGMVMLVVISHHRPYNLFEIDGRGIVLPIRAFVLAQENRLADLVAPRFANTCNEHEARRFIAVALLCIHPTWQLRPTMDEVVQMLSGHMDIPPMDMRTIDIILSYDSYHPGSESGGSMGR